MFDNDVATSVGNKAGASSVGEDTTSDKDVLILNFLVASKSEGLDPESVMPRPRDFYILNGDVVNCVDEPIRGVGSVFELDSIAQMLILCICWGWIDVMDENIFHDDVLQRHDVSNDFYPKSYIFPGAPIICFA